MTNEFKWAADPYCVGCRYYTRTRGRQHCDYQRAKGQSRSLICGPGKDCTVREEYTGVKRNHTKAGLTNTYRKPPVIPDEPGSLGMRTITLEGMPGYVSDRVFEYLLEGKEE